MDFTLFPSKPSSSLSLEEKTPVTARRGSHDDRIQNQNNNTSQHQQNEHMTTTTTTTSRQNSLGLPEPKGGHQQRRLSDCGPITQHQQGKRMLREPTTCRYGALSAFLVLMLHSWLHMVRQHYQIIAKQDADCVGFDRSLLILSN